MLKWFNMDNSKKGFSPYKHGLHLSKDMDQKIDEERWRIRNVSYALIVGRLMYIILCTKPNITYIVSVTSTYQTFPGEKHRSTVSSIFKNLRRTKDLIMTYIC